MRDLREQLRNCVAGRICLVGLGNLAQGDDGFGVRLAETLGRRLDLGAGDAGAPPADWTILLAGTALERCWQRLAGGGFDQVVLLDAVDFGAAPGSAVLLGAAEIRTRFPLVSTHRMSLGLWAQWLEGAGIKRVWLLGVQPASLRVSDTLSAPVQTALTALTALFCGLRRSPGEGGRVTRDSGSGVGASLLELADPVAAVSKPC